MNTPAAKRRRIERSANALSKPFRSPFKGAADGDSQPAPSVLNVLPSLAFPKPVIIRGSPLSKVRAAPPPITQAALNADPIIAPLVKAQRALEQQLRDLKEDLDAAKQARKIETDSATYDESGEPDAELIDLVKKWRDASRLAADELFGGVREKVNRMGGPKAWRERQKEQQAFLAEYNQEEHANVDDDVNDCGEGQRRDPDEKRDLYAEYDVDPETEIEKDARGGNDPGADDGPEDEFTMRTMLKMLNIELNIIGYDPDLQRWTE